MNTVYLIATIDSMSDPPRVVGVSLIGEPWEIATLSHSPKRCYVNLWKSEGNDWDDAVANLRDEIAGPRGYPGMQWALAWVDSEKDSHPPV
jgi:hypothetical protein